MTLTLTSTVSIICVCTAFVLVKMLCVAEHTIINDQPICEWVPASLINFSMNGG